MSAHFNIALPRQVRLRSGRVLRTLGDAVVLIGDHPDFPNLSPGWNLVCEAIQKAAVSGRKSDVEFACCELELTLAREGLL